MCDSLLNMIHASHHNSAKRAPGSPVNIYSILSAEVRPEIPYSEPLSHHIIYDLYLL